MKYAAIVMTIWTKDSRISTVNFARQSFAVFTGSESILRMPLLARSVWVSSTVPTTRDAGIINQTIPIKP